MTIRTTQDSLLNQVKTNTSLPLGSNGSILIDDTADHTGPYFAITALADAELDVSSCTMNIEDAIDFTIPKGVTIYGQFTVLSLGSGSVIAYKL
jgi:hypothetical protein|tara:strand:+ start:25790 stop:26071 length:282 start_codon:yes stop_codon:yes gene_type:complete